MVYGGFSSQSGEIQRQAAARETTSNVLFRWHSSFSLSVRPLCIETLNEDHKLSLLVHRSLQSVISMKGKTKQSFKFLNESEPDGRLVCGEGWCLPRSPPQRGRERERDRKRKSEREREEKKCSVHITNSDAAEVASSPLPKPQPQLKKKKKEKENTPKYHVRLGYNDLAKK